MHVGYCLSLSGPRSMPAVAIIIFERLYRCENVQVCLNAGASLVAISWQQAVLEQIVQMQFACSLPLTTTSAVTQERIVETGAHLFSSRCLPILGPICLHCQRS